MRVCVCVCVRVCACVRVRACVRACVCMFSRTSLLPTPLLPLTSPHPPPPHTVVVSSCSVASPHSGGKHQHDQEWESHDHQSLIAESTCLWTINEPHLNGKRPIL